MALPRLLAGERQVADLAPEPDEGWERAEAVIRQVLQLEDVSPRRPGRPRPPGERDDLSKREPDDGDDDDRGTTGGIDQQRPSITSGRADHDELHEHERHRVE